MKRYYKLTQIRNKKKEEIYFMIKRGKLEILYHLDFTNAQSSSLERISKNEIKVVLARKRGLENIRESFFLH